MSCCVGSCTSRQSKKGNPLENPLSFHEFPSDCTRREQWEEVILKNTLVPITCKSKLPLVCGLHFKESDFVPDLKKKVLKKSAVPNVFEPIPGLSPECANSILCKELEDGKNHQNVVQKRPTIFEVYDDVECIQEIVHGNADFVMCGNSLFEDNLYCRLCAKLDPDCIPIFEEEGSKMELNMKILKYLPINLCESDNLPAQICPSCVIYVNEWHEYAKDCLIAENKLQEMFYTGNEDGLQKNTDLLKIEDTKIISMEPCYDDTDDQEVPGIQEILNITVNNHDLSVTNSIEADCDPLTDTKIFPCNVCFQEFTNLQAYYRHKKRMHSFGTYKCKLCSLVFNDNLSLVAHKISHHNYSSITFKKKKTSICPVCNVSVFARDLKTHLVSHEELSYCTVCNTQVLQRRMKKHLVSHENLCKICFQIFPDSEQCKLHKKTTHDSDFLCETCGKNLKTKDSFNKHMSLHTSRGKLIKCDECGKTFFSKGNIRRHIEHNHLNKKICDKCGEEFATTVAFTKHVKCSHPLKCNMCVKRFKNEISLNNHVYINHYLADVESLKCVQCDKTFISKDTLKTHVRYKHVIQKATCEDCGKIFNTVAACKTHIFGRHIRLFRCKICRNRFVTVDSLNKHMEAGHVSPVTKQQKCLECNKIFKNRESLHDHVKHKHVIHNTVCETCGRKFVTVAAYKKHFRQTHLQARPFKCNLCVKDFKTEHGLAHHKKIRHCINCEQCKLCGFFTKNNYRLKLHMRSHQAQDTTTEKKKIFESKICDICGKSTYRLKHHMKSHEPKESRRKKVCKSKICDICGISTSSMYRHKLEKHKIKRHKCSFCDKCYMCLADKKAHERAKHTGERPFVCLVCSKSFFSKSNLVGHSQVHSTSLNYSCEYCNRLFLTRNNRNDHRRRCLQQKNSVRKTEVSQDITCNEAKL